MIDFNNKIVVKMDAVEKNIGEEAVKFLLLDDETIEFSFKGIRDILVITDKRAIYVDTRGITGKKKDYASLPWKTLQSFSIETAGLVDIDSELELWFNQGMAKFALSKKTDIKSLGTFISKHLLNN